MTDEIWNRAIEMDPENVAREWLARHQIKVLELQRPRLYTYGAMRMVLRLTEPAAETLMRACGKEAVLTDKFIETEEDSKCLQLSRWMPRERRR